MIKFVSISCEFRPAVILPGECIAPKISVLGLALYLPECTEPGLTAAKGCIILMLAHHCRAMTEPNGMPAGVALVVICLLIQFGGHDGPTPLSCLDSAYLSELLMRPCSACICSWQQYLTAENVRMLEVIPHADTLFVWTHLLSAIATSLDMLHMIDASCVWHTANAPSYIQSILLTFATL